MHQGTSLVDDGKRLRKGPGSSDFRQACCARGVAPPRTAVPAAMATQWLPCLLSTMAIATEPHLTRWWAERWAAAQPSWSLKTIGNPIDRDELVHSTGATFSPSRTGLARGWARYRGNRFTRRDTVTSRCSWMSRYVKESQVKFYESRGLVQVMVKAAVRDSERGRREGASE